MGGKEEDIDDWEEETLVEVSSCHDNACCLQSLAYDASTQLHLSSHIMHSTFCDFQSLLNPC